MPSYFRQDFFETPDRASIYFQMHGMGDPGLVLCDGLGCDGFVWKYLLPRLQERSRVVRWHYRGHGRSSVPEEAQRVGMDYNCEDLARVMDVAGLPSAVLFGHSMGVQVALEFQRRYPERVRGLVLICGSYGNPLDTFHDGPLLKRAFPYLYKLVESFPAGSSMLTRIALSTQLAVEVAMFVELNRELMQRRDLVPYFDHLARMNPVVFVRTLKSLSEHTTWEHLPRVNVPTLVMGGEVDKFTPAWLSSRMAQVIPGAKLVMIPGGSHTAPLEQPVLVWETVERFLTPFA